MPFGVNDGMNINAGSFDYSVSTKPEDEEEKKKFVSLDQALNNNSIMHMAFSQAAPAGDESNIGGGYFS